jgi:NADPH:quinone reductase-like Zn-dependent oxidoreductase
VGALGVDLVVDSEREDFTALDDRFDIGFDAVGRSSFAACRRLLRQGGVYASTDLGPKARNPLLTIAGPALRVLNARRVAAPLPRARREVIAFLRARLELGELTPVIDRTYPLDDIVNAFRYVEAGRKTGNVAVLVA